MELEQLRAFVAVAEEKSYTKAGERLYMSHSTMSRAVSALEHEFGVRLISRDNHVAGLTPEGEKLCEMAKKLLDMAAEIEEKNAFELNQQKFARNFCEKYKTPP